MRVRLVLPQLEVLDGLQGQCLLLSGFAEDRPLRGLSGLVDWRLNGQLSRLMVKDFVDVHYREATLSPIHGRLPFERLLLVGLGRRSDFNAERFEEVCRFCFATLTRMGLTEVAMTLPGRVGLDVGLRPALAGWRRALLASFSPLQLQQLNLTLLEVAEVQRELVEPMRQLEREVAELIGRQEGPR